MLITVYSVIAIILIPITGFLSDRFGRKIIIVPSLIITGIGGLISGLAAWLLIGMPAYWIILLGRLLQGIGAAGAFPIVLPLVGDLLKTDVEVSKGLGLIETSNTLGKVLSPILGTLLAAIVWYIPFFSIPVFCMISVLLILFFVKTPQQMKKKEKKSILVFINEVLAILKQEGRWLYVVFAVGCINMFVLFGVLFFLSSFLEDQYNIIGLYKGLTLAIPLAALSLSSFLAGKWVGSHKDRMKWIIFSGMLLSALSILVLNWSHNLWLTLGILMVSGIGLGASLPCLDALLTEGIEKEQRGTISALYSSMRFIGVAIGPPIISLLLVKAHLIMFGLLSGSCVLASLTVLIFIRTTDTFDKKFTNEVYDKRYK
jgi:ACDE family multidrug resistance protein